MYSSLNPLSWKLKGNIKSDEELGLSHMLVVVSINTRCKGSIHEGILHDTKV